MLNIISIKLITALLVRPEAIACGADLSFAGIFLVRPETIVFGRTYVLLWFISPPVSDSLQKRTYVLAQMFFLFFIF